MIYRESKNGSTISNKPGQKVSSTGRFPKDIPAGWVKQPKGGGKGGTTYMYGGPVEHEPSGIELFKEAEAYIPKMPKLEPYSGEIDESTQVPLTPSLRKLMGFTENLLFDPESSYRKLLSGEPDQGDVQTLINQARRDFEQQTLPAIQESFAGGPLGSAGTSGAASLAEAQARAGLGEAEQRLRIAERQRADQNALAALQLTPQIAAPLTLELQNDIANLNRNIAIHFENEGLKVSQYASDLARVDAALSLAGFDFNVTSHREEMELQEKYYEARERAAKGGIMGGLIGTGIGAMLAMGTGPAGVALGATLGGQVGSSLGTMTSGGSMAPAYAAGAGTSIGPSLARDYYMKQLLNIGDDDMTIAGQNQPVNPEYLDSYGRLAPGWS